MSTSAPIEPNTGPPMFVHDFAAVPGPVDDTIRRFTAELTEAELAAIVANAWNADAKILVSAGVSSAADVSTSLVRVRSSGHRLRGDAVIVNLSWSGDGWLPALDADLELVAFGHDWTHLHLMGRYKLPDCVDRYSTTGSLVQRVMVVVVRRFLTDLSNLLVEPEPD